MAVKRSSKRSPRAPGRPRTAAGESLDARTALLDAAATLFADRGYRGTSVEAIIARAGLSKGTFYWHFDTKHELLLAVLDDRIDRPLRELVERLQQAPADDDMAPEASRLLLAVLDPGPETVLLEHEYRSLAMRDRSFRARYAKRQAALRRALAEGLDARARRLGAPPFAMPTEDIATAYLNLGSALAVERLIDAGSVPDSLLGETVALVYQGLVARAERPR